MTAGSGALGLAANHQSFNDCGAFGSALTRNRFSWNLDAAVNDQYRASLKVSELGSTVFAEVIFDPIEGCSRPADCADDDRHRIILTLYDRGSASFICGSGEVVMHPDEMLLLDGSRNCSTLTSETVQCKTILFPRDVAQQHFGRLLELKLHSPSNGRRKRRHLIAFEIAHPGAL